MAHMRSLAAKVPASLAAALALALTLGGGSALAAPGAPAHPARSAVPAGPRPGVTFHKLTLQNGWVSGQVPYDGGDPAVGISNGIVYLSGSVRQPSPGPGPFASLPPGYRPAHSLYLPVYALNGSEGSIEIDPDGLLYLFGNASVSGYASLAGISFPRTVPSQQLTLVNGWQSSQTAWDSGNPAVSIRNGVAYLSGSLHNPSAATGVFATLPPAGRPSHTLYLPIYTNGGSEGSLKVTPQGTLQLAVTGGSKLFSSLAGISYPVALASQQLKLQHGWQPGPSSSLTGAPSVSSSKGIVYLSGTLRRPAGSSLAAVTQLPAGDRPSHWLYFPVYTLGGTEGSLSIAPDGRVSVYGSFTQQFTSLAGLHFPVGS